MNGYELTKPLNFDEEILELLKERFQNIEGDIKQCIFSLLGDWKNFVRDNIVHWKYGEVLILLHSQPIKREYTYFSMDNFKGERMVVEIKAYEDFIDSIISDIRTHFNTRNISSGYSSVENREIFHRKPKGEYIYVIYYDYPRIQN